MSINRVPISAGLLLLVFLFQEAFVNRINFYLGGFALYLAFAIADWISRRPNCRSLAHVRSAFWAMDFHNDGASILDCYLCAWFLRFKHESINALDCDNYLQLHRAHYLRNFWRNSRPRSSIALCSGQRVDRKCALVLCACPALHPNCYSYP